jgi:tetratricopeptide (TPR) repeat protein
MIGLFPEKTYIDGTEGGALIKGTRIMKLGEALDLCLGEKEAVHHGNPGHGLKQALPGILGGLKKFKKRTTLLSRLILEYESAQNRLELFLKKNPASAIPGKFPVEHLVSLKRLDKISRQLDSDPVMNDLKGLLAEHQDRYLAFEMDLKEALSSRDEAKRFKTSLDQQFFLQAIRKQALEYLCEIVDEQINFISRWIDASHVAGVHPEPVERIMKRAGFFFEHDAMVYAEDQYRRLPDSPVKNFHLACVAMKQGKVKQALAMIQNAVENDPSLKSAADFFISSMVDEWAQGDGPESYKGLILERIEVCDPSNILAVQHRQSQAIEKIWDFVEKGEWIMARDSVVNDGFVFMFENQTLVSIFGFLLLITGMDQEGEKYLKRAVEHEFDSSNRKEVISRLHKHAPALQNPTVEPWFKELVHIAEKEIWAMKIIQELWVECHDNIHSRFLTSMVYPCVIPDVIELLKEWESVRQIIPEWHVWNAYLHKSRGDVDQVLMAINKALEIEAKTIPCSIGKGWLYIASGSFYLLDYQYEKSLATLDRGLAIMFSAPVFLITACVCFWTGNESEGLNRLERLFRTPGVPDWVMLLDKPEFRRENFEIIKKIGRLNPYAAWNVLWGQLMVLSGVDDGWGRLKAAVFTDDRIVTEPLWADICDVLREKWEDDSNIIEEHIRQNEPVWAEKIMDEWDLLFDRFPLPRFLTLKTQCLMMFRAKDTVISSLESRVAEINRGKHTNIETYILWEELGDVFFKVGQPRRALDCYEKAMISEPDYLAILSKIGDAYDSLGNVESAIMAYQALCTQWPSHAGVRARLDELKGSHNRG